MLSMHRAVAIGWAGLSCCAAIAARAQHAAIADSMPAVWVADTFGYHANPVLGRDSNHLLMPMQIRNETSYFEIHDFESWDDGAHWKIGALVARQQRQNQFDPAATRASDGSLLVAFENVDSLTLYRSVDEGRSWKNLHVFHTHGTAEVYWQNLAGRLAMIFATLAPNQTTTYWARSSPDGLHWSDAAVYVGDGGAIRDGFRPGLGPLEGRIVHAAYSYRRTPTDTVEVRVVALDAVTLRPVGPPVTVARAAPVFQGISVFPLLASCPDGLHIFYSTWVSGPPSSLFEVVADSQALATQHMPPPRAIVQRRGMLTGFGRAWLVRTWDGVPRLVYSEEPDPTHTRILSMSVASLAHCTF